MLRASERKGCNICTISYDQPGAPIPQTGDVLWVGVRCQFQCRSCGHLSPLNHLDVDGSVTCLRCGLEQVFDNSSWDDGLDHAMRCGALAGESGKYKQLGITMTSVELVQNEINIGNGMMNMRSLRVAAGPGHPPCSRCHKPLEIEIESKTTKARCTSCGATQTCELPPPAKGICSAVCGVIAEELLLDRREAKVDDNAGAIGINCAHCAAPLKVTGVSTIVSCEYCGASSRIPRRTMFQLGHDKPVMQLWWLAFSRSGAAALISPPQREHKPRHQPVKEATFQPQPIRASEPEPAPPSPKAEPPKRPGLGILAGLGIVALVGLIGYRDDFARWIRAVKTMPSGSGAPKNAEVESAPASSRARTSTPAVEPTPRISPTPSSATSSFVALAGCKCGVTQLRAQVDRHGAGTSIRLRADRDDRAPFDLDVFEISSDALGLGLTCDNERIVIAAGPRVAAWSLDRTTKVWDREMSAPYRVEGSGKTMRCATLRVRGGQIAIPTTRGPTTIKLIDGL